MAREGLRIGCGCGFWGDSAAGPAQLVQAGNLDFLVLDYLSEITLSLLARARRKRPELGYTGDFISEVMRPLAAEIAGRRIRVVANAGGVNPAACRDALEAQLRELGVPLQVAVVLGDDVSALLPGLRAAGARDLERGAPLPEDVVSANAYLGAFPIAAALDRGAQVVITGRCVDSALALGPLIHAFGWGAAELDRLSMGSLAGHIIECGPQATGGISTDWRAVASGWDDMGYPIVECARDGSFVVSKPEGTGGRVSEATVAEQITYEVHDPARYVLPDVVCDWSAIRLQDLGSDRVRVLGARGRAPTGDYKVSLTYADGYRCTATLLVAGPEAAERSQQVAHAILKRTRRLFAARGWPDYREVSVEVLGAEALYGVHARTAHTREVLLKIAVAHDAEAPLELFAREIFPAATSMAQGITGFAGGRPGVQPIVRLASCLIPKARVPAYIEFADAGGARAVQPVEPPAAPRPQPPSAPPATARVAAAAPTGPTAEVPLLRLAYARSGDKGDTANIGVLARRPEFVPVLDAALSAQAVRSYLGHLVAGEVQRHEWPGLKGWNFVLHQALGGGGVASLRYDPQGKSYAQLLLDLPIPVPVGWLAPGGLLATDT
ncbi:MAG TPA: acyclic terpene utilization AtuA family protein [Steroidobacteraceae bacterium]|nr:acyclic terpene utilization AtuA family protein [Steroidobacteraceae bacterium]